MWQTHTTYSNVTQHIFSDSLNMGHGQRRCERVAFKAAQGLKVINSLFYLPIRPRCMIVLIFLRNCLVPVQRHSVSGRPFLTPPELLPQ